MMRAFYKWRMKRCAVYALKSMHIMDYKGAVKWLKIAKRWEVLATR
jgi:hypothetical protein